MKAWAIKILLTGMVLLTLVLGVFHYTANHRTQARLIFHLGPSFYLDINRAGQVVHAAPNNEAGQELLESLMLRRVSLDTALDILGQALYDGGAWKTETTPFVMVSRLGGEEAVWMKTLVETKMMSLREEYGERSIPPMQELAMEGRRSAPPTQ